MQLSIIYNFVLSFLQLIPFKKNYNYFRNYGVIIKLHILPYWIAF